MGNDNKTHKKVWEVSVLNFNFQETVGVRKVLDTLTWSHRDWRGDTDP